MHWSEDDAILIANRPIDRTAFRTKSTSTSEAYLEASANHCAGSDSLLQLRKYFADIVITSQAVHDFELGELDVNGIVVLAEEDFDFILQDGWTSLDDEKNVAQSDVLDFWAG